jgi:hypothetical protein
MNMKKIITEQVRNFTQFAIIIYIFSTAKDMDEVIEIWIFQYCKVLFYLIAN